ncbi:hypothetical protein HYH02_003599 [Chlamydomonas schloesseri]|uniref:Uncharacterized protein n=1 Tax=Chlamydomonas schloesseri TaxID=2026947 RepID=A0A836B9S3_9CHLO|nr:hypothetical protein HYH02_003599 [Chlamydomonas schloesseri]|eukprot:KAG2451823.1 hypothetical protein HYH02_003599 [Chlamydomonas schloesseri]
MGLATQFAVPLLFMVLFRNLIKRPVGTFFLEGLNVFLPLSAPLQQPPPAKTTKKDRRMLQKRQLALKGAQSNVFMQQISPSALNNLYEEPATYGGSFEALGVLLLMLLGGVLCHFTLGPLFGLWQDVFVWSLSPVLVVWAVHQLLVLQAGGSLLRLLGDRAYVAATAVTAAVAAYLLLVAAPRGWVCWDVRQAAPQLDELWNVGGARVLAGRMNNPLVKAIGISSQQLSAAGAALPPMPQLRSDPMLVAAGLAAVAGVLAASLMGSCVRIARLYSHISPVPQWAEQYLAPPAVVTAVLRLALAVPLVVVLYGVKPMAGFLAGGLGVADPGTFLSGPAAGAAGAVGPVLLLVASLLFILLIRPLAAAHLGTGLLEWHVLRHSDTTITGSAASAPPSAAASASVKEVRDMVARRRLHNVYATVCQAALQLLGPATILTALLLMYGSAAGSLDHLRPATPLLLRAPLAANTTTAAPAAAAVPPPVTASSVSAPQASPAADGLEGLEETAAAVTAAASAVAASAGAAAKALAAGELPPMPSLAFVAFATSFLSWFCCAAFVVFTYPMLFIYRTGMHIG